jgi:hypothetical protein
MLSFNSCASAELAVARQKVAETTRQREIVRIFEFSNARGERDASG